jgi:hypothetical protein
VRFAVLAGLKELSGLAVFSGLWVPAVLAGPGVLAVSARWAVVAFAFFGVLAVFAVAVFVVRPTWAVVSGFGVRSVRAAVLSLFASFPALAGVGVRVTFGVFSVFALGPALAVVLLSAGEGGSVGAGMWGSMKIAAGGFAAGRAGRRCARGGPAGWLSLSMSGA